MAMRVESMAGVARAAMYPRPPSEFGRVLARASTTAHARDRLVGPPWAARDAKKRVAGYFWPAGAAAFSVVPEAGGPNAGSSVIFEPAHGFFASTVGSPPLLGSNFGSSL